MPLDEFIKSEIKNCISEKKWKALRDLLVKRSPATVAELIKKSDKPDCIVIFRSLPREFAADVF